MVKYFGSKGASNLRFSATLNTDDSCKRRRDRRGSCICMRFKSAQFLLCNGRIFLLASQSKSVRANSPRVYNAVLVPTDRSFSQYPVMSVRYHTFLTNASHNGPNVCCRSLRRKRILFEPRKFSFNRVFTRSFEQFVFLSTARFLSENSD